MKRSGIKEFLAGPHKSIVDVRSPAEFEKGHIAGARNIPLFNDEERAVIGTLYKQRGKSDAISRGVEIAGPKMAGFNKKIKKLADESGSDELGVYCWRGGMRSEKMAWLFELVDMRCTVLEGGYKAFRHQLLEDFENRSELIVLQGTTGAGKTELLGQLALAGEQVIDLEALAGHRGSAFGAIGRGHQPTTQQFQNNLYSKWKSLDTRRRIWVEGESRSIGKVYLPDSFWESMNIARLVEIEVPRALRIERLVRDYGNAERKELREALMNIERRLGGQHTKKALLLLEQEDLAGVADLLLDYYDRSYAYSRERYKLRNPLTINLTEKITAESAKIVAGKVNSMGWN